MPDIRWEKSLLNENNDPLTNDMNIKRLSKESLSFDYSSIVPFLSALFFVFIFLCRSHSFIRYFFVSNVKEYTLGAMDRLEDHTETQQKGKIQFNSKEFFVIYFFLKKFLLFLLIFVVCFDFFCFCLFFLSFSYFYFWVGFSARHICGVLNYSSWQKKECNVKIKLYFLFDFIFGLVFLLQKLSQRKEDGKLTKCWALESLLKCGNFVMALSFIISWKHIRNTSRIFFI